MSRPNRHTKLLSELKLLTPRERRFALRLAKSSRVVADRYVHTIIENRKIENRREKNKESQLKSSIKEGDLRSIIRRSILDEEIRKTNQEIFSQNFKAHVVEQVVGYTPPAEKGDGDDGGGYLSVGDMGVDTSLGGDSPDEEQASANQVKKLTQQRQQDLDQGNTTDAENDAQQLSMARGMRG